MLVRSNIHCHTNNMAASAKILQKLVPHHCGLLAPPHGLFLTYLIRDRPHAFNHLTNDIDDDIVSRIQSALHYAHPSYDLICYGSEHSGAVQTIRAWTHAPSKKAIVLLETFDSAAVRFPSPTYSYILNTFYKQTYIMDSIWYTPPPAIVQRISTKSHVTLAGVAPL